MLLFMPPLTVVPELPMFRNWGTPASFTPFSRLPAEIRLMIWECIYVEPREVLIKYHKSSTFPELLFFQSRTPVPILFHICSESRAVAMKWYQRLPTFHPALAQPPVPLCPREPPAAPHRKFLGRVRELMHPRRWRRARRLEKARRLENREDQRAIMPIYYSKRDTVFIMPRSASDQPSSDNLRQFNRNDLPFLSHSGWQSGRYTVLCSMDLMKLVYTVEPSTGNNPDIELALSCALPGVTVLFPLVDPLECP